MATHGTIGEFDGTREDWTPYTERLQQYFAANDITNSWKQRTILLSACGASTNQLIGNLLSPAKPSNKSFAELTKLVQVHQHPLPSVTVQLTLKFSLAISPPGRIHFRIRCRVAEALWALRFWRFFVWYVTGPAGLLHKRLSSSKSNAGRSSTIDVRQSTRISSSYGSSWTQRKGNANTQVKCTSYQQSKEMEVELDVQVHQQCAFDAGTSTYRQDVASRTAKATTAGKRDTSQKFVAANPSLLDINLPKVSATAGQSPK